MIAQTESQLPHITIVCCPNVFTAEQKTMREIFPKVEISFITTHETIEDIFKNLMRRKTGSVIGYHVTQGTMETLYSKTKKVLNGKTPPFIFVKEKINPHATPLSEEVVIIKTMKLAASYLQTVV